MGDAARSRTVNYAKTKQKKAAKLALTINSCNFKVKRSGYGLAICRWTQHRVVLLDASFKTVRYALLAVFVAAPPVECKAILQPRNFSRVSHCQLFFMNAHAQAAWYSSRTPTEEGGGVEHEWTRVMTHV